MAVTSFRKRKRSHSHLLPYVCILMTNGNCRNQNSCQRYHLHYQQYRCRPNLSLRIIDRFRLECKASSLILRFLNFSKRLTTFNSVHSTDKHCCATSLINEKGFIFNWNFAIFWTCTLVNISRFAAANIKKRKSLTLK